jgi:hypothetical protein
MTNDHHMLHYIATQRALIKNKSFSMLITLGKLIIIMYSTKLGIFGPWQKG